MSRKPPAEQPQASFSERVYQMVSRIPRGRIATYGQIATLIGSPRNARRVGQALGRLSDARAEQVPWHRVLNAQASISAPGDPHRLRVQRALLEAEGIEFDAHSRVLAHFRWQP